ncbi:MAG: hypothetical protein COB59_04585 [Rhodospirillaceae bacterium]|nr:MAG: hypothetical protein COB59_04585 [Rhodospirillaceae bacterium]
MFCEKPMITSFLPKTIYDQFSNKDLQDNCFKTLSGFSFLAPIDTVCHKISHNRQTLEIPAHYHLHTILIQNKPHLKDYNDENDINF